LNTDLKLASQWAALLSRPSHSPFAAYCTGFYNLLGQAAVTAGITFGCSGLIATLASLHGFEVTAAREVGISAALLVFGGLVNTFGIRFLAILNRCSIALHSVGVFSIAVALLAKAPTHRTAKEVFATFNDASGWSERASPAYVALTGILVAQYTQSESMPSSKTVAL
jgi:amino acid transporter